MTSEGELRVTALALAARDGDDLARAEFVRATRRDLWRFNARLAGAAVADDLTQETYLRALTGLPRFAGRSSARTWLFAIARRVAVDQIRAVRVRPRQVLRDDWQQLVEWAQPRGLPGFDDGVVLDELLDALDADRRDAFVLTQLFGLSYAETAAHCDCAIGTIRSRVARARADLIRMVQPPEDEPPRARRLHAVPPDSP
ncbi:sigma-70 family RNA polymerase sigma factor [Amycolatopsis nigrescens]|uniref:sigma-70 family RNA polymerase sigma factor n=1 Tax=Amycolatopsis nigrescens TaxID=381445 RepID=UPI000374D277|nr:sigma-70 family RNA polymerase sigma factor [Amycolatopsis nigrescens]